MRLTWYDAIIRICVKGLIFNKLSQLWADVKYHVPTIILFLSGVFRRETASGFYPWGKVDSPRKRVAEWLCGWRHGNSFPMTQSAQSHRQMRSIPHCLKAVFCVFVFDSIHNSATFHNLSPGMFHWTQIPYYKKIPPPILKRIMWGWGYSAAGIPFHKVVPAFHFRVWENLLFMVLLFCLLYMLLFVFCLMQI